MQMSPLVLVAWVLGLAWARQVQVDNPEEYLELEKVIKTAGELLSWESLPVILSPLLAVVGFFVKSFVEARAQARQLQLERVQLQIQEFYGPISALSHRGKTAFNSMLDVYARHIKAELKDNPDINLKDRMIEELASVQNDPGGDPTANPAVKLWVQFITSIAFPVNSKIVELLTDKSHLHDGPLPDDYLDLFALVAERELVIAQWERGDYGQLLFRRRFPTEFDHTIGERLQELQELQLTLGGGKFVKKQARRSQSHASVGIEKYCLTQSDSEPFDVVNGRTKSLRF